MGFGYACDETEELMPLTHVLATKIGHRLTVCRKTGVLPWLLPDGKTQVTVEYTKKGGFITPNRVHTILISTQHKEVVTNEQIQKDLMEEVIKPVVPQVPRREDHLPPEPLWPLRHWGAPRRRWAERPQDHHRHLRGLGGAGGGGFLWEGPHQGGPLWCVHRAPGCQVGRGRGPRQALHRAGLLCYRRARAPVRLRRHLRDGVQARRRNSRPGEQEVRLPRGYDWRASGPQEGGGRGEAGALPEDRGVRALRARRPGRLHVGEGRPPP